MSKPTVVYRLDPNFAALADSFERATAFRNGAKRPRIAVVGDYCLDKYLYLYPSLDEISVETRLTAYQARAKRLFAGVGGTIANNLCALGADVLCFGVVGNDGEGFDLLRALQRVGANVEGIVRAEGCMTGCYMKPMRPVTIDDHDALPKPEEGRWIESNRIDLRNPTPIPDVFVQELQDRFRAQVASCDAVVVSDQFQPGSEAIFSPAFRAFLAELARDNPNVFFLCDSRFFADQYRDMVAKCNANELLDAAENHNAPRRETSLDRNAEADDALQNLADVAADFARRAKRPALVTRGEKGSLLLEVDANDVARATVVPAVKVEPPIDVCGAGDASNAGFAFARALKLPLQDAAQIACVVSSITIKQIGATGVASVSNVVEVLRNEARRAQDSRI